MPFFSPRPARQRGGAKTVAVVTLLIVVVLVALYTLVMLNWSYSNGERAGWLQKLSRKGFICKTQEGELSMIAVPGATPEKFYFTVRDPAVAQQIEQMMGRRVSLRYEQKIGLPTSCFGDTEYFVTAVQEVPELLPPGAGNSVTNPSPGAPR